MANAPKNVKKVNNVYKRGKLSKKTRFSSKNVNWKLIIALGCILLSFIFAVVLGKKVFLAVQSEATVLDTVAVSTDQSPLVRVVLKIVLKALKAQHHVDSRNDKARDGTAKGHDADLGRIGAKGIFDDLVSARQSAEYSRVHLLSLSVIGYRFPKLL